MWRIGVGSVVVLVAVLAGLTSPPSDAARDANLLIRTGRSIGKFQLGMTQQRLLRVAGRPRHVVPRGASFGQRTVEWQYGLGAEYIVTLFGRPGRMRVTEVSTTVRRERTPRGIGTGSRESALRRAHPTIRCGSLNPPPPPGLPDPPGIVNHRDCTLFSGRGTRTVFKTEVADTPLVLTAAEYLRRAVVVEVVVTSRRPSDNPWGP